MKPQFIRILDIGFIGPLMILGGIVLRKHTSEKFWGNSLIVSGVGTIGYNLVNYLKQQETREQ